MTHPLVFNVTAGPVRVNDTVKTCIKEQVD